MKHFWIFGIIAFIGIVLIGGRIKKDPADKIYTPSEVWNNKNFLVNKQITIEGFAEHYQVVCTERGCPGGCCNSCVGGLGLRINEYRILRIRGESEENGKFDLYDGKEIGCSGNECNIQCCPLEKGKKYRVTGILKIQTWNVSPYEEFYLELRSFELI